MGLYSQVYVTEGKGIVVYYEVFNKKIITDFSFTPKSAGYNFGSDRSFDKLYSNGVDRNISNFVNALQINKSCLK